MALINPDRIISWTGKVGVEGDIPTRTTIYQTLSSGATNAQIQTALDNCPSGQVVKLNAGTYTISSGLSIPSNVTLRGAGIDQTYLTGSGPSYTVGFHSGYTESYTTSSVGSSYVKGADHVDLADASAFSSAEFIYIDELNDPAIPVQLFGYGGIQYLAGREWAVLHKVQSISGNTIYIDPPAIFTFPSGRSPMAVLSTPTYIQNSGVEELTILNNSDGTVGILFQGAANCWAYKVKIDKVGSYGIKIYYDAFRNTVRQCVFHDTVDHVSSDRYAVTLFNACFNLIESCLFDHPSDGIVYPSSSGNVFAYNYFYGVHRDSGLGEWFWGDCWSHGSLPGMNLFEGNYGSQIVWDDTFGTAAYNTIFRERRTGYDESGLQTTSTEQNGCIVTGQYNPKNNIIGCVLGKSGYSNAYENTTGNSKPIYYNPEYNTGDAWTTQFRHRNFNYYTNTIKDGDDTGEPGLQESDGTHTLPESLYLASKPSWFGSQTYPPVDPENPDLTDARRIPAQYFYDEGDWPAEETDVTAPVVSISTSDPSNITTSSISIAGTATDAIGVTLCKYRIGAAPNDTYGTNLAGTTSWSGTVTGLSPGVNTVYVGARDAAGNWGTDSMTVNYNVGVPMSPRNIALARNTRRLNAKQ